MMLNERHRVRRNYVILAANEDAAYEWAHLNVHESLMPCSVYFVHDAWTFKHLPPATECEVVRLVGWHLDKSEAFLIAADNFFRTAYPDQPDKWLIQPK